MSTERPTEPKNQTHLIAGGINRLAPNLMTVLALVPLALDDAEWGSEILSPMGW